MKAIARNRYLDKLIALRDTDVIKIVTGMRRCGKSTLLDMMRSHLADEGIPAERLLTFKMESFDLEGMRDWRELYRYVVDRMPEQGRCYIFFDELQEVIGWERTINALRVDRDCDIYVTGSNAFLLSSEIATLISGRYVEITMHPLSFSEYVDFHGPTDITKGFAVFNQEKIIPLDDLLDDYMKFGGLPYLAVSELPEQVMKDYILSTYRTIISRDILARDARRGRYTVTDADLLNRVSAYLSDNISNLTSTNKIVGTLNDEGTKISRNSISAYMAAIEETYIFSHVRRFDIKGRDVLKTGGKYYIEDLGIRSFLDGYRGSDSGRILENAVYNRLVFDGYRVFTGHLRGGEIDFVAIGDGSDRKFIQVTESIDVEATRERELRPLELKSLEKTAAGYEKVLVVRRGGHPTDIDGIRIISAVDFLMGRY